MKKYIHENFDGFAKYVLSSYDPALLIDDEADDPLASFVSQVIQLFIQEKVIGDLVCAGRYDLVDAVSNLDVSIPQEIKAFYREGFECLT